MEYAFLVAALVLGSLNNYLVPFYQGRLFNTVASVGHFSILVMSIWYLGWLWGIVFFLLYFFSIIHSTVGWLIIYPLLPKFFSSNRFMKVLFGAFFSFVFLLVPCSVILMVVSFFVSKYKCLITLLEDGSYGVLIYVGIAMVVGCVIRIFAKKYEERRPIENTSNAAEEVLEKRIEYVKKMQQKECPDGEDEEEYFDDLKRAERYLYDLLKEVRRTRNIKDGDMEAVSREEFRQSYYGMSQMERDWHDLRNK